MTNLFLILLQTTVSIAAPYPTASGKVIRWDRSNENPSLTYSIETSAAAASTLVGAAFTAWTSIPGTFLRVTQATSGTGDIVVKINDSMSSFMAARAVTAFNSSGVLTSCAVELRTESMTASYAETYPVVLHEVGHCLGLNHSVVDKAVMSYRNGGSTLTADDEFALLRLYHIDPEVKPLGCATVRDVTRGGGGPGTGTALVTLLFAVAWALARRPSRPQLT